MGTIIPKLRQSARGQCCTLAIAGVCNLDQSTVVLAHLPSEVKGGATKSDDWHAVFACNKCHTEIDEHRLPTVWEYFYCLRALQRTHKIWRDMGLIVIAGDVEKPRKSSHKIVPRRPLSRLPDKELET